MRRLSTLVAFVVVIAGLIATFDSSATAQLAMRHEASDSDAIYQHGQPIQLTKVLYVRDNLNPNTCTQVIIVGEAIEAVPADAASCAF